MSLSPTSPSTATRTGHGVRVVVFDVNETLSDLGALGPRFSHVGVSPELCATWFAGVLRDGFALTVNGARPDFSEVAEAVLTTVLHGRVDDVAAAVKHVMAGFTELPVHPDVVEGIGLLRQLRLQLVTLSNGSTSVARALFERSGLSDSFQALLSVDDAPLWKPAAAAYESALAATGSLAEEVMLVAVHPWDVHGAHGAGLCTAWLNRSGVPYPSHFAPPDLQATSVVDLAAQLGAVGA